MSSNLLLVQYNADDFSSWSWISLDKEYQYTGEESSGDLDALASYARGKRLLLLIAGRSLLITKVDVPDGNNRVVASAIPYALEEQLAEDIELVHCASGKRQADGTIPVIAVAKSFLMELLQTLDTVELYPIKAIAEPLLLPLDDNELAILIRGDNAIVRTGQISGFECSFAQLPAFLAYLKSEMNDHRYTNIRLWGEQKELSEILPLLEAIGDQISAEHAYSDLRLLTGTGLKQPAINLLTEFDGPNSTQSSEKSWWLAAAMSLLALVIYLSVSGYQYYSMQSELKSIVQESETLFREAFPDVKRLVQSRLVEQAKQKLDQRRRAHGKGGDDLLAMLLRLGEVKKKNGTIELKDLEFRQNSLIVNLLGKSVAEIEEFKQQLDSGGGTTSEILSAVSKDKKVKARIKIRANQT